MEPETSDSPVAIAIKARLSYLQDNLYRWRHMGSGCAQQDLEIRRHEEDIAALKADAERLGVRL